MKLLLLPLRKLTSDKVFLYGIATKSTSEVKPALSDRIVNKASSTWLSWEAATGGWKKAVVGWGNKAVSRIDYREHSLKSIMSRSSYERYHPDLVASKLTLSHPSALQKDKIASLIKTLADEGYPRHRQKLIYSFILMPFTAPFMLVPIVPNLPFFYVAFRAWSHYRAMMGSSHLKILIDQDRISYSPSEILDELYNQQDGAMSNEKMKGVLQSRSPEMAIEVERANAQLTRLETQASEASPQASEVSPGDALANKRRSRTGLHK